MLLKRRDRQYAAEVTYLGPEGPVEVYVGGTTGERPGMNSESSRPSRMFGWVVRRTPKVDWRFDLDVPIVPQPFLVHGEV